MTSLIAVLGAIAFYLISYMYASRAKHPYSPTLAAALIFVTVFATVTGVVFSLIVWALSALNVTSGGSPGEFVALLLLAGASGFFGARWQLKKPPLRSPDLQELRSITDVSTVTAHQAAAISGESHWRNKNGRET